MKYFRFILLRWFVGKCTKYLHHQKALEVRVQILVLNFFVALTVQEIDIGWHWWHSQKRHASEIEVALVALSKKHASDILGWHWWHSQKKHASDFFFRVALVALSKKTCFKIFRWHWWHSEKNMLQNFWGGTGGTFKKDMLLFFSGWHWWYSQKNKLPNFLGGTGGTLK